MMYSKQPIVSLILQTVLTFYLAQLGKDWNADPTREDAFKVWNVQFNAKPKANVVSTQKKKLRKIPKYIQSHTNFNIDCWPHLDQTKRVEERLIS